MTLRPLRPALKFLHSGTGLRRPNILGLFVVPECDQPWTPGACSDYGQPTGRSRHRIDFFLYGSSSGNFRPRHEEPSMVMVFARADTQEKGFPMWDFAFPHRKSDFQCRISFSCTGRVISCAGFHISGIGKAISSAEFLFSALEE